VCIAHLGEQIRAVIGDGRDGIRGTRRFSYSQRDGEKLLGTAGAIAGGTAATLSRPADSK